MSAATTIQQLNRDLADKLVQEAKQNPSAFAGKFVDIANGQGFFGYTAIMNKTINDRVLERLLEPISSSLNEEAARKLIGIKADRKTQARVAKLAGKCNEGELTAEERDEYEFYVMAGEFIAILQAQARLVLARRGQPK